MATAKCSLPPFSGACGQWRACHSRAASDPVIPDKRDRDYILHESDTIFPMEWLFSWEVSSWIVGLGIALAFGFIALDDFKLAKLFFLLAAADAAGGIVMWGIRTTIPTWLLSVVVGLSTGSVAILFVLSVRYVDKKQEAKQLKEKAPVPRAHIHVTKFEWNAPADEGGHASVKIIFVNDGNAPTTKVQQASKMAYFAPTGDLIAQRTFDNQLLSPEPSVTKEVFNASDNQIPVGVDRSFIAESPPWTKAAIDKFLEGNAVVYVAGTIFYSDELAKHKTTYCGFIGRDGNMKFCGKNNQEP